MDYHKLAELLFPHIDKKPEEYLNQVYPRRQLPQGAMVTRFAPSPTGFLHIGGLFTALVNERVAHQTGGAIILRIEDTDKKREVEDGITGIVEGLRSFGITFDEGMVNQTEQKGAYGPYQQSHRAEIYQCFCKSLVEQGLAYPCFCTEQQLAEIRRQQEGEKALPGYHTTYARCRDLSYEQVEEKLRQGLPYVVRLRSPGKIGGRIKYKDVIRGEIEMDENVIDVVLLKTDGIPTYHFAHAVDDSLMGTTHVIRSDEWVSSVPLHLQLFYVLGLKPPKYAHVSPIMKEEDGAKRKLSKRKDPEAAVSYFVDQGYPKEAVLEYLLGLANSGFEDWRRQNKGAEFWDYKLQLNKMSQSGALFDLVKLADVSAQVISRFPAEKIANETAEWAKDRDQALYQALIGDLDYAAAIFAIDRGGKNPRKDIRKWSDVHEYVSYFYEDLRQPGWDWPENISKQDAAAILEQYAKVYDEQDDKNAWFDRVKSICQPLGFCPDVKAYKADPAGYKGHVGDVSAVIRVAITGRRNSPDLWSIMALLGKERCLQRLAEAKTALEQE